MTIKGKKEIIQNPSAPAAEMAVLGAAMIEKWAAMKLLQMLRMEDFFEERHRLIYESIKLAAERVGDSSLDVVSVMEELRRRTTASTGEKLKGTALDEVTTDHVKKCMDTLVSAQNVEVYAKYVKEASLERSILKQINVTAAQPTSDNVKILGDHILSLQGTRGGSIFDMRQDLGEMIDKITEKPAKGIPSGFAVLDHSLNGGPVQEELVTIGARPGDGKTAVMLKMACNMAEALAMEGNPNNECILYLTTEMTVKSLVQRILPMVTGIPHAKFRTGLAKDEVMRVVDVCGDGLDTFPLKLMGKSSLSMDDIKGAVYQAKPKVVFIDYLQRCRMPRADNMAYAIADFMAQLKSFMVDCQITGIIGCQSDRELDKTPDLAPTMSHLKGSGGIESESDIVLMLWRPSEKSLKAKINYVHPNPGCTAIEAVIRKSRSGQNNVFFDLQLDGALIKMTDRLPKRSAVQGEFDQ